VTAWATGDLVAARALAPPLTRLAAAVFAGPNPTVIKGALHALGRIPTPAVRLPLLPAERPAVDAVLALLEAIH
jgi:4-hydroxy-tetrahydrodipicolinate synthase